MDIDPVIERKFSLLDEYLFNLTMILENVSFAEFSSNWPLQRAVERSLQVLVEIVVDVAERIIAKEECGPVATSAGAVEKLVQLGVLASASPYREMIALRNIVVHQYAQVDPAILYRCAKDSLGDFVGFRNAVDTFQARST